LGKRGIRILRNTLSKWNYCAEILYISVKKSRERLLRRLEENTIEVLSGDLKERERWDDYMQYYEEAINNTSTDYAPW
jgi:polyphosphate kinase 2 (PPK2 family)